MERSMCPRLQYTDLTYMGGNGSYAPMRIIFGSIVESWYINLNIKFDANWTLRVVKTPV